MSWTRSRLVWALPAFALALAVVLVVRFVIHAGEVEYGAVEELAPPPPPSAVHVEPAPLGEGPLEIAFVGPSGDRPDGWPRAAVDQTVLRALLLSGRYRELTAQMELLQDRFEAEPRLERWITEAMLAFRYPDPSLDAPLDAWVATEGASFAPHLARCAHLDAVGWAHRGGGYIIETSRSAIDAMNQAMARATVDCERALALRPRLVAARQRLVSMAAARSMPGERETQLALALSACPTCLRVRIVAMTYSSPRWGGSIEAMRGMADAAIREHPDVLYLRALAGETDRDLCHVSRRNPQEAIALCDSAIALGSEDAYQDRALAHARRARVEPATATTERALALSDIERALELSPQLVESLTLHAELVAPTDPERAIGEYLTAARLDPNDQDVISGIEWARVRTRALAVDAGRRSLPDEVDRLVVLGRSLGVPEEELAAWRAPGLTPAPPPN